MQNLEKYFSERNDRKEDLMNRNLIQRPNVKDNNEILCLVGRFDGVRQEHLEAIRRKIKSCGNLTYVIVMPDIVDYEHKMHFLESRAKTASVMGSYFSNATCLLFEDMKKRIEDLYSEVVLKVLYDVKNNEYEQYSLMIAEMLGSMNYQTFDSMIMSDGENAILQYEDLQNLLFSGDIEGLNSVLERKFCLDGPVVYGAQNGRKIGFPTANIQTQDCQALPADGVYAVKVVYDGKEMTGMANIGYRPTFSGCSRSVEVNIFDFDADIYGEVLELCFYARIRDERMFENIAALKVQIEADKARIKAYFE